MTTYYPLKRNDIINSQTIFVNTDDFYTATTPFRNVMISLPYTVHIPSQGNTQIRLQKVLFDDTTIETADTKYLMIYMNNLSLLSAVNTPGISGESLVATIPVLSGGLQHYLESIDSGVQQQVFDNTSFREINMQITNQSGEIVSFSGSPPIFQFVLETQNDENSPQEPTLMVQHGHSQP
eukprot:Pgem_evm10s8721